MAEAHIPKPKFGWSDRIAKDLEERMEKINEPKPNPTSHISLFDISVLSVPKLDDPPELEANGYARQAVEKFPLSPIADMKKLIEDNRPRSPWGEWAMAEMEAKDIKRCIPANRYDSEGTLVFGLTAV